MRSSEHARAVAAGHLSRRDLSRQELQSRLERAGLEGDVAADALDDLERWGLVDDERSARALARRLADRGYGDRAIDARLESRGLKRGADAIDGLEPELVRAKRLVQAATRRDARRLGAMLSRRGFSEDVIEASLRSLDTLDTGELR